ncbi:MAG: hypothetical protein K2Y32_05880 [Candidatus Obscuribacterales bacterium]|nr:hypothetical protein [Candidatus Obscuribacterales bacterium]
MKKKPISFYKRLPKLQLHEHIDCSLRPYTMLDLWSRIGFEKAAMPFPAEVVALWQAESAQRAPSRSRGGLVAASRRRAARAYGNWVAGFARESLKNYLDAIVLHVLPLMHDMDNLSRIVRERIEDAIADGHIAIELRFGPQLHLGAFFAELDKSTRLERLDKVMQTTVKAVESASLGGKQIPVKLIICALRHENGELAEELADLAIKYKRHVGGFDLAGDESGFPGVLDWWMPAAARVKAQGIKLTMHGWETNEPTARDIELLASLGVERVGHGVRGNLQGERYLEICPTSNVVTGQFKSFADHPIDRLYRAGRRVTVNTDGTLFTQTTLSLEYKLLAEHFGWREEDFLQVNLTALEAMSVCDTARDSLRRQLIKGYRR